LGELKGSLPVAGLGVRAADALHRAEPLGVGGRQLGARRGGLELSLKCEGFVVAGLEFERGGDFA
jgi:hypothetical protein